MQPQSFITSLIPFIVPIGIIVLFIFKTDSAIRKSIEEKREKK
jgi:hypothetical protein